MSFAVCRTEKIHDWASLEKRAGHNERATPPDHAWQPDPENPDSKRPAWIAAKPVFLVGGPGFAAKWKGQVDQMKLRKLKEDQRHVLAREMLLSASPEFFEGMSRADVDKWAAASVDWAKARFGADRVGQAVLHLDEQTPHLHLFLLPTKATKTGLTLSDRALGLAGSKHDLSKLQDDYAAAMQPFKLERGKPGSSATHQKTKDWRRQMTAPLVVPRVRWDKMPAPTFGDRFDLPNYAMKASRVAFKGVERHHAAMIRQAGEAKSLKRERWKLLDQLNELRDRFTLLTQALGQILHLGRPFDFAKDLPALQALLKPKAKPAPAAPAPTIQPARREAVPGAPVDPRRQPRA